MIPQELEKQLNSINKKIRGLECEVQWFATSDDFPTIGKSNTLYIDKENGAIYYWDGDSYEAISGGGGGSLDLEVNGTPNLSQILLNLVEGDNVTITDLGGGDIEISATGGGGGGATNLGYTQSPTQGTVTSDTGTDAVIPAGSTTNASLMLPADKTKLNGIEALAQVNNISNTNATDLTDGGNTTLHIHDSRYYTESEIDILLSTLAVGGSSSQLQYNDGGLFNGISGATTNGTVVTFLSNSFQIGSSLPFTDTAGVLTLRNVDVLDATTEATIEAAIDTLANLTSIQGLSVTLADAAIDVLFGWDDSASAYQNLSASDARLALGLATSDSPQFAAIELSHATQNTLTASAGVLSIEGVVMPKGSGTANEIAYWSGANTLGTLTVATYPSLTELSYVKGVTSAIQTQFGTKAPSTSPTFATSITGSYLTASEILITDGSKNIISATTATYPNLTELSYVKGVTSAIQTQLDAKLSLTGGTMTGNITLAENAGLALDPAGSADGKWTGITIAATAGYTQAFGDLVYLDPTDSRWELSDANSATNTDGDARGILGMVVSAGTDGTACTILLHGVIRADAKFPTFTINASVYVSETAGAVTQTAPTTSAVIVRKVGTAITADELYFNPSDIWITII